MDIYRFTDYSEFLRFWLSEQKKQDSKYTHQVFSERLRIQKSYLSQVLSQRALLTDDQTYLALKEMELPEEESEYFQLLVKLARTGLQDRKSEIKSEIKKRQQKARKTEKYIRAESVKTVETNIDPYYLDPMNQLIHVALSLRKFQRHPEKLLEEFQLTPWYLEKILSQLEQSGFIARKPQQITVLKKNLHLSKDSPVYEFWRRQVRLVTAQRANQIPPENAYNFSVFFSADSGTRDRIHDKFLDFLNYAQKEVQNAPSEEVYAMSFDLFPFAAGR